MRRDAFIAANATGHAVNAAIIPTVSHITKMLNGNAAPIRTQPVPQHVQPRFATTWRLIGEEP